MKKFLLALMCCVLAVCLHAETKTATLSFASTAQRTSFSTSQQVWEQNGIKFTNNKGSGSNIADYSNPVRLYQNSEIIIEFSETMTKIEFTCNSGSYATALKNSIGTAATVSGSLVTVNPNSTSFTVAKLTAQVRINSLMVSYEVEDTGGDAELAEPEIAWSAESYTATLGEEYLFPTLINPNTLPVTYESSNTSVATIDSNGTVAIVGAGITTISAEFAGDETYKASTVSYELTVIDPNDIYTEISVDDFKTQNGYTAYTYTDEYGITYSTVFYTTSGLMQYNTGANNNNGKGSGLNITANNSDYIVKSIDIEFASGGKGVNVYASSTPFDALVKTTSPNYSSYTKVNSSAITTSTTNISINAKAFAIIPSASGVMTISKITVHYALDASDTREEVTLEFSESECSAVYGEYFAEPTLTVNPDAAKEEVKYSSNNTEVATVDPTSGEVTLVGAGNATITAEIKDSETYKYAKATYTLNVSVNVSSLTDFLVAKPETTTVISEPVTVYYQSPDKKYMFITDGTTNMMVYGTLSNTYQNGDVLTGIAGTYTEYGGMDELIPDATTFGEATEGTPIEPKAVTLAEEIAPCDFVILTGVDITGVSGTNATVTDGTNSISAFDRFGLSLAATENATIVAIGAVYNSTKQIYIVSITETPDTREDVTLTFSETECSAVYGDAFMEPTLAVNPDTAAEEVKYSSSNTEVATVDAEGKVSILAAGETTITAAIKDSETYKDAEASYTLTVIELGEIMFNDFVLDEGHGCGAFVGKAVTISAANAEVMSYTIDGGDLVEVEGSSFTWTPEAVGNYAFSVSAYLGGQDKTVNFTVTVEEQPVGPEIEYPAYIRINQAPVNNNWAGRYLIIYEDGNVAFDGSLETLDVVNNNCNVTISEGYIKATDELANSEFTIAAIEGSENAWSVKSASNVYIGRSKDDNGLNESETELQNTISFNAEDGTVNIIGTGGAYLRYNSASNQNRFRYYKTSSYTGQKPIALYRYAANKDDDATAIEEVEAVGSEVGEAQWYDLNGRRVAAPGKGIYILKQGNKATKYAF